MAKKTYTAMPAVPPEVAARYETVMSVLSGELTVSEGARRLGLSRNHFQSLMHRAMGSLIEELGPKPGGRPAMPESERRALREAEKLRLQNLRLKRQVETTDRMLSLASGLMRGRVERRIRRDRGDPGGKNSTEDE
jgi:hypothetical protein